MFDWEDFLAGWIAGVAGILIGHPMDTIKTRQQTLNLNALHTITTTLKYEGIRGFYKGMLSPLLTIGPINSLFFGVYGNVLQLLQRNANSEGRINWSDPAWKKNVFIAGCVGGLAQCFIICPVELIKIELQLNTQDSSGKKGHSEIPHKTPWGVTKNIIQKKGILGLYKGLVPTMWRDMISSMIYMPLYESYLIYNKSTSIYHIAFAGGLTGVLSWASVYPFDVIKARIQADNPIRPQYKGMVDCIRKLYQQEGVIVFSRGLSVCLIRAFPVNAVTFIGYETTLTIFQRIKKVSTTY